MSLIQRVDKQLDSWIRPLVEPFVEKRFCKQNKDICKNGFTETRQQREEHLKEIFRLLI